MILRCWLTIAIAAAACLVAARAEAAGFQLIAIPADAAGPALTAAIWSPCATPPGKLLLGGRVPAPGNESCPIDGEHLPLVVMSHGYHGWFGNEHDTAEALADAGFVAVAVNHPIDTGPDMSRADDLAALVERPADIKRLIDFMLLSWPDRAKLDPDRVGFFGFSRGGYTGLVVIGGKPDIRKIAAICPAGKEVFYCRQARRGEIPAEPLTHDPRVRAAVLADPAFAVLFDRDSLKGITVPVQLWVSGHSGDGATLDGVSPANVARLSQALPSPPDYHVVADAAHLSFIPPCSPEQAKAVPAICTDPPGFDRVAFHQRFNADVVAFFRKVLTR